MFTLSFVKGFSFLNFISSSFLCASYIMWFETYFTSAGGEISGQSDIHSCKTSFFLCVFRTFILFLCYRLPPKYCLGVYLFLMIIHGLQWTLSLTYACNFGFSSLRKVFLSYFFFFFPSVTDHALGWAFYFWLPFFWHCKRLSTQVNSTLRVF